MALSRDESEQLYDSRPYIYNEFPYTEGSVKHMTS